MATWGDLSVELSVWADTGRHATLWWRDDDAIEPTRALARMLAIGRDNALPLGLAVIPENAQPSLADLLADEPLAEVLVHGWRHVNHAPPDRKKSEFGDDRPAIERYDDLRSAVAALQAFPRMLPVFVPPWNRMAPETPRMLAEIGYAGVSTFQARPVGQPNSGLRIVNTHADIIDWHGTRGFAGEAFVLDAIIGHLVARRTGKADAAEPTGILSHHLVHDAGCWTFLARLFAFLAERTDARVLAPHTVFLEPETTA